MRAYQQFWEVLKTKNTALINCPEEKHHQVRVLIRREANRDIRYMQANKGRFYISASSLGDMLRLNIVRK